MKWQQLENLVLREFGLAAGGTTQRHFVYIIENHIRLLSAEDRNVKYFFIMKSTYAEFQKGFVTKRWNRIERRCQIAIERGLI